MNNTINSRTHADASFPFIASSCFIDFHSALAAFAIRTWLMAVLRIIHGGGERNIDLDCGRKNYLLACSMRAREIEIYVRTGTGFAII